MDFITLAKLRIADQLPKLVTAQSLHDGLVIARKMDGKKFCLSVIVSETDSLLVISSDEFSGSLYLRDNYLILKNLLEDAGFKVFCSILQLKAKTKSPGV